MKTKIPLLLFAFLNFALPAHSQSPTVQIKSGTLQGITQNSVSSFKGIPYAAPPVGQLRWHEPKPPSNWQSTRLATNFGKGCIQDPKVSFDIGGDAGPFSEDCLYLNVWTPNLTPSQKLPVMVWIYGGAYIAGSSNPPGYDGTPLAQKGAVVVSFNYRLGALGFFAHPALAKDHPNGPVNFGLLDQIAALQWVQDNIAQFGGNPHNVTIFGQSAGAKSVLALFASPYAHGLFQKGIALSTYAVPDAPRAKASEVATKIATALGLDGANATADQLRAIPAEKFPELKGLEFSVSPVPISGDPVLPQSIQATFAAGREAPLPLLLGNTSDDSSVVLAFGVDPAAVIKKLRAAGFLLKSVYPGVTSDAELGRQVARDLIFTMPVRWTADLHSKRATTYRYYFDYTAVKLRPEFPHGVRHGGEIIYAFDTGDINPATKSIFTQEDRATSELFSDYLFHFAATGDPNSPGAPVWKNHNAKQDATLVIANDSVTLKPNFMRPRLNLFITTLKLLGPLLSHK